MTSPVGLLSVRYEYDLPTEVHNYELLRRMASHFLTNQHLLTMLKKIVTGEQEVPSFHSFVSSHRDFFYTINSDQMSVISFIENFKNKIEKETVKDKEALKDIEAAVAQCTENQKIALSLLTEASCFFYLNQEKNPQLFSNDDKYTYLRSSIKFQFFYYIKTTNFSSIDLEELKIFTGLIEKANLQKIQ